MYDYHSLTHIQHFVVNEYILHHPHSTLLTQLEAMLPMIPSNYKPTLLQMSLKVYSELSCYFLVWCYESLGIASLCTKQAKHKG